MADLRKRFGLLVAAHRRRCGLTQERLAEAAELSPDMIAKIEAGTTGARFPAIERLAAALGVDPAELFSPQPWSPSSPFKRKPLADMVTRLAALSDDEIKWVSSLLDAALKPKGSA